ncbi:hypothetical protein PG994_006953 [Apiospora phragmitis]|uniref:Uncharacterized protein n=1 Tax=Apiospora phragmitis TaxID=2905665 RepID=A0ABR1VGJ9_9PEZI
MRAIAEQGESRPRRLSACTPAYSRAGASPRGRRDGRELVAPTRRGLVGVAPGPVPPSPGRAVRLAVRQLPPRQRPRAAREQFVVGLGCELVRRGAPLDAEPAFLLRDPTAKPITLRGV